MKKILLGICPRELKTHVHTETLCTNAYNIIINNSQKVEITQMSAN